VNVDSLNKNRLRRLGIFYTLTILTCYDSKDLLKCQVFLNRRKIRIMTKQRIDELGYTDSLVCNNLPTLRTKSQLNTIITNKDGKPDYLAINIYWDNFRSWYSPKKQHQADGNVVHIKKLKTQGIYSQAKALAKIHGASKETIRKKIVKLEKLGLVLRSFKHKFHAATNTYNQRIIYVLQDTPHFFNPCGINKEEIKEISPQTNAEYIKEKYGIIFTPKTKQTKPFGVEGGIHTLEGTKKLRESFNKLKDRSNESTFLNNSDFSILQPKTSKLVEIQNKSAAEEGINKTTVHTLKPNNAHRNVKISNHRKKTANSYIKSKRVKLLRFNQYHKPKTLAEHYPLSNDDCSILQSKSCRDFNLNSMNEILLSLSKKSNQEGHIFPSKASFMAYMSKTLLYEKRDAVQINNIGFRINANLTIEDIVERTHSTKIEVYLSEVETKAITNRSDEAQFRAKLVGVLGERSYDILPHLVSIEKKDEVFELHLNKALELTKQIKDSILKEANAVDGYRGVEKLEFIASEFSIDEWCRVDDTTTPSSTSKQSESLELPQGVWGLISKELVAEYGIDIYRNWFKKLTATVDENTKTIELKTSSEFVKDWIVDKYKNTIEQIVNTMGFELKALCARHTRHCN
jgi:hypothetical protein